MPRTPWGCSQAVCPGNPPCRELLAAPDVVDVVGIAAVDEDIARLEMRQQVGKGLVHTRRRDHHPDRSRLLEPPNEIRERGGSDRLLPDQLFHRFRRPVEDHALVASPEEPPYHVGPHPPQPDHPELHSASP